MKSFELPCCIFGSSIGSLCLKVLNFYLKPYQKMKALPIQPLLLPCFVLGSLWIFFMHLTKIKYFVFIYIATTAKIRRAQEFEAKIPLYEVKMSFQKRLGA